MVLFVLWVATLFAQQSLAGGLLYEKPGNLSLAGLFGHVGGNCNGKSDRELEEIVSAIWTIQALNAYQYLPGVTIGLKVFDGCEVSNNSTGFSKMEEDTINIGLLTTESLKNMSALKGLPDSNFMNIKHIITEEMLADITIQLLTNLQWTNVGSLVADSSTTLNFFREKALQEGVSVVDEILLDSSDKHLNLRNSENVRKVTVVIASFPNIIRIADGFRDKLILAPTDFVFDLSLLDLPEDAIVCLPSMQDKGALSGQLKNIRRRKEFFTRKPPVKGPLFLGTAATILSVLQPFRSELEEMCPTGTSSSRQPCASAPDLIREIKANKTSLLSHKTTGISPDDVVEALKVLKIEPSFNDEMFLYIVSIVNANSSEDFAIFQIFNFEQKTFQPVLIMIDDDSFTREMHEVRRDPAASLLQEDLQPQLLEKSPDTACDPISGFCSNHPLVNLTNNATEDLPEVSWRYLTWVSVNTSIGFVGVTCTLSIMLFIAIKVCKDEFLDGSPCFTLLLMVAVILTYVSSIPFHLEFLENGFMCLYRQCAPPVVFALLFSLLLSRSIMIAFSEAGGGLSGHINGYLQSVLCVFMVGVQISITLQNWIFSNLTCIEMPGKYNLILTLAYDFLLLILLACVSPFIVRSKRNCKEGLLFSISVFFITIVWSAWISFYVLLSHEHRDAAVAVGLNLTASVLLLCVFIPQMYLMAALFSQDPTVPSLSSLDRHVLSHSDFKSSHALNDCAFGSYRNCELGCANPSFTARPNGSGHPGMTESDQTPEASQPN